MVRKSGKAAGGKMGQDPPALKVIVAVDFGTTFSGVAYANTHEPQNQKIVTDWGSGFTGEKTPTVLKYDNDGTSGPFKWGFEATRNLRASEKVHEWFKLGLCPEFEKRRAREAEFLTKFPSKTALDPVTDEQCEKLVTDYLRALRESTDDHFKRVFDKKVYEIQREYIITVPAMWTHRAQNATQRCAVNAGMGTDETIQIIAEPEAAGIYALHEMSKIGVSEGDAFVICDAGGGTVDLSSYTVESLKPHVNLAGTSIASGGLCGSSFLNRIFADYLQKELGIQENNPMKMKWLKNAVNNKFESDIKPNFTGKEKDDYKYFIDVFGLEFGNTHKLKIRDDALEIPAKDIRKRIFDPVISKIEGLVRDQIAATKNVKAVLLVGGFGRNVYLCERLKDTVNNGIKVRPIEESRTAIVRGALIAGLSGQSRHERVGAQVHDEASREREHDGAINTRVVQRLAPNHFGVRAFEPYDPAKHKDGERRKILREISGDYEIEVIQWFVRKGDPIRAGKPKIFGLYYDKKTTKGRPSEITCEIYTSEDETPPLYPHTEKHPNSAIKKPLLKLEVPLTRLPEDLPTDVRNGHQYYIIDFDVQMSFHSASFSFVLARGDEKYEPKLVKFAELCG